MRFLISLIALPLLAYGDPDIVVEVPNRDEFYAVQYMCISDAVSCALDISEKVNPDKEEEVEKAKANCCLKLAYCAVLVDKLHPLVFEVGSDEDVKDTSYTNNVAATYQETCGGGASEMDTGMGLRMPAGFSTEEKQ